MPTVYSTLWNRYELISPLSQGGFGSVFKARRLQDGATVALKFLQRPELKSHFDKFVNEAHDLYCLKGHPNILKLQDWNLKTSQPFLVTEYCPFGTARDFRNRHGMSYQNLHTLTRSLLGAILAVHERGGIHRDIKPDNMLIGQNESGQPTLKLADFGLANLPELLPGNMTQSLAGTEAYWSPELKQSGQSSQAADIYAAGISLIELATGFRNGFALSVAFDVPNSYLNLIREMISPDPSQRPSAAVILQRLEAISPKPNITGWEVLAFGGVLVLGILAI
jgi:serine/threonine-protein kinase